jgi:hypothetical protein
MAQAQLEFTEETLNYFEERGIQSVQWSPYLHQISCQLDEKLCLVVKKTEHSSYILLKKGTAQIKLGLQQFETLCDLKESVLLLKSFLDGQ